MLSPGEFVRGYLSGKRVGFLGPIKFFFYSFMVQVLFSALAFWLTNERSLAGAATIDLRFEVVSLVSTIFWGLLWAVFYRKSELSTVENVVAAVYFIAQANFLIVVVHLLMLPFAKVASWALEYSNIIDATITIGYSFYFAKTLFNERAIWLIPKLLLLTVLYLLLLMVTVMSEIFLRISANHLLAPS